jgi:hypothetical protein
MSFDPYKVRPGDQVDLQGQTWIVGQVDRKNESVLLLKEQDESRYRPFTDSPLVSYEDKLQRIELSFERLAQESSEQAAQSSRFDEMMRKQMDDLIKLWGQAIPTTGSSVEEMLKAMGIEPGTWDSIKPPKHVNARSEIAAIKGTEDLDQKYRALKAEGYNVVWEMDGDLFHRGLTVERVDDLEAAWAFVDYLNDDEAGEPLAIRQDDEVLYHRTSGSWQKDERCKEPIPAAYAPAPKRMPGVSINYVGQDVRGARATRTAYDEISKMFGEFQW